MSLEVSLACTNFTCSSSLSLLQARVWRHLLWASVPAPGLLCCHCGLTGTLSLRIPFLPYTDLVMPLTVAESNQCRRQICYLARLLLNSRILCLSSLKLEDRRWVAPRLAGSLSLGKCFCQTTAHFPADHFAFCFNYEVLFFVVVIYFWLC